MVQLDGHRLTPDILYNLGAASSTIRLSKDALENVKKAREVIADVVDNDKTVYGITTGFGYFSTVKISNAEIRQLQYNLVRSHASGVGDPLSNDKVRRIMAVKINDLARGFSGISAESLERYVAIFNSGCVPYVPEQGTVGASGDLAPLSHIALGLIGEGKMWNPTSQKFEKAGDVLKQHNVQPLELGPKEGLSLINGTQLITAISTEALVRSERAVRQADIITAMSVEVLKGTPKAFDKHIHFIKPHSGQNRTASVIRSLIHSEKYQSGISEKFEVHKKVQDAYSLRCVPQVHGVVHDTLGFIRHILTEELNSSTDNPSVFQGESPYGESKKGFVLSGGNFHGEYPAKMADMLAIAIHEVGSISEQRISRMITPHLNAGLPPFLIPDSGLNSGFMIPHCAAAALVSENKQLCSPASIDSIPTSAHQEDHVSMGGWAARKSIKVVSNIERILAIEVLENCQALDLLRPVKTTEPLEKLHAFVRQYVKFRKTDLPFDEDIEIVAGLIRDNKLMEVVQDYITIEYPSKL